MRTKFVLAAVFLLAGCAPKPMKDAPAFNSQPSLSHASGFLKGRWMEDDDPEQQRKTNALFKWMDRFHAPVLTFQTNGSYQLKISFCTVQGKWVESGNGVALAPATVDGYTAEQCEAKYKLWEMMPTRTSRGPAQTWLQREDALRDSHDIAAIRVDTDQKRLVSVPNPNPNGDAAEVVWVRVK